MTPPADPRRVRIRMMDAGFGESLLLTVEYAVPGSDGRDARHLLFDLGTTRRPPSRKDVEKGIAELVARHTSGHLDVLVVTHRHKDHLSGFADRDAAATLSALAPDLVLRPWTEDPRLAEDATSPDGRRPRAGSRSRAFVGFLAQAQSAAERLAAAPVPGRSARAALVAAAAEQQPNAAAIRTLDALAAGGRGRYLYAGRQVRLGRVVPGLTMTVLGPPTVEQSASVTRQASRDPEYWMLRLGRSLDAAVPALSEAAGEAGQASGTSLPPPGPVRWLVEHLDDHRTQSVSRLVRSLDDALNNTSLILLLEIGELRLLFPGDAQIENWRYTLDRLGGDEELKAKLANLDLYKVGHHGSRNATPRTLHALWAGRPANAPRMTALMSTLHGVHGKTEATRVPRATLVTALKEVADLHTTDGLPASQPFVEVVADVSGGPFTLV